MRKSSIGSKVICAWLAATILSGCEEKKPSKPSKSSNSPYPTADSTYTPIPRTDTERTSKTGCKKSSSTSRTTGLEDEEVDGTSETTTASCVKKKTPSETTGAGGLGGLLSGLFGGGGVFDLMGLFKMVPKVIDAIGEIIASFTGGGGGLSSPRSGASRLKD